MKNNSFLTILLVISLITSVVFCILHTVQTRKIRDFGIQVNQMNLTATRMQAVASVCMEYAKTNATIDPVLESVGLNPKGARAAAKAANK